MSRTRWSGALALVSLSFLFLSSTAAHAQPPDERVRIGINYGTQGGSQTFDDVLAQPRYLETETITTTYDIPGGPIFDAGVAVRLAGRLAVGVAVSAFTKDRDAAIAGSVPHPFFFETPRTFTATEPALEHKEVGTHVQAAFFVPTPEHLDVTLGAGPSFFHVTQGLVSKVSYIDNYPYDTVAFDRADTTVASESAVGFHVSADIGYRFSRHVGVGVLVRFSKATIDLALPGGGTASIDAGGAQAAGGIRFVF